ncbi:unnamed protein product [Paramecium primaurelia]|uniref:RBR-type E3 ubiquitin transferase n=1 Tax=Paramecium primaurelia TaxID=5886 RepID=A0A8S1L1U9_PARPR|nr:unnamed protein product [Paramecium primaurelia]
MSYFNLEQHETKSHSDYSDQLEQLESNQFQTIRRNSLPIIIEDGQKKLKEKFILSRINELGLDQNKALYILDNMEDDIIMQNDENVVLHRVIQTILLMDSFPKAISKQQQGHYFEQIKQLIGKTIPNLFSYLNYQKNYKGEQESLLSLTCTICLNELKNQNMKLDCYHQFCLDCLNNYIVDKISNGQVEEINCPQIQCTFQLNDDIIGSIIDQENMNKLKRFRKIKMVQSDQNIIWCPRPGCEEIIRKKSQEQKIKCICGQFICNKCNRKFHITQSCKDQLDQDLMETAKKFKILKCNQCRSLIQKNDGCNHIICSQCKYQFCWLCKQKYTIYHFKYYNIFGCPGMQYSHRDPYKYPNVVRFLRFLFLLIFGGPIFLIGFIIGFIALTFILPAIYNLDFFHSYEFQNYNCCKKTAYISLQSITCILLSPLSFVIVTIFLVIFVIFWICYIIDMLYRRINNK